MAKIVQTIYCCDICHKEVATEKSLYRISLPCFTYDCEGRSLYQHMQPFDLCGDCKKSYYDVVTNHFARITVNMAGYTEVERSVEQNDSK